MLSKRLRDFAELKGWEKFHTSPNLAQALAIEVGELQELFIWGSTPDKDKLEGELADVYIYLTRLADVNDIDLNEVANAKMDINEARTFGKDGKRVK